MSESRSEFKLEVKEHSITLHVQKYSPFTLCRVGSELQRLIADTVRKYGRCYLKVNIEDRVTFTGLALSPVGARPSVPYGFQGTIRLYGKVFAELKRDCINVFLAEYYDLSNEVDIVEYTLILDEAIRLARMVKDYLEKLCIAGESGTLHLGIRILLANSNYSMPEWVRKLFERHRDRVSAVPSIEVEAPRLW